MSTQNGEEPVNQIEPERENEIVKLRELIICETKRVKKKKKKLLNAEELMWQLQEHYTNRRREAFDKGTISNVVTV